MEVWEGGDNISELLDYPVRGLVFEGGNTLEDPYDVIGSAWICIQRNNIPYNVLIANCWKTMFSFPQVYCNTILPIFVPPSCSSVVCIDGCVDTCFFL